LIWLGTKLKIIGTSTVNQIYLDKFLKNYQVTLDDDIITEILIDSNGKFIDIGVYINDLLKTIAHNQTTAVNMVTKPITNSSLDVMSVIAQNSAQIENVTFVTETLFKYTIKKMIRNETRELIHNSTIISDITKKALSNSIESNYMFYQESFVEDKLDLIEALNK